MSTIDDTPLYVPEEVTQLEAALLEAICDFFKPRLPDISLHWQKFLFAPWVHFFIHGTFDRWARSKSSINSTIYETDILTNAQIPGDTGFYMELNRTTAYMLYLDAFFGGKKTSLKCETRMEQYNYNFSKNTKILGFKTCFPRSTQYWLQILSLGSFRIVKHKPKLVDVSIDLNLRLDFEFFIKDFLRKNEVSQYIWISKLATVFFPYSLLENLIIKNSLKITNTKIKNLYSANAWMLNDSWKINAIAHKIKFNTKFIGSPHAFNHSISKYYWERDFESLYLDNYYLWGNANISESIKDSIKNFSAPHFTLLTNKSIKPAGNNKYLISTAARPIHLLEYPYLPEKFQLYLDQQIILSQELQKITCGTVVVRSRPNDLGWNLINKYSSLNNKNITINYQNNKFINELKAYDLHVCDNISTTIMESLNANFPTLIVLDKNYFQLSNIAVHHFNDLERVGILHYSIDSLLCCVQSMGSKRSDWWSNVDRQQALKKFMLLYNFKNKLPFLNWLKILNSN